MNRLAIRHCHSAFALLALAFACTGTETDNPVADPNNDPRYDAPPRFEPVEEMPGCIPPDDDSPPRNLPLWGRSGNYLVGLDAGLSVVDVSAPNAPVLAAHAPLYGYPRQLIVEGNDVTVVIDELPVLDTLPIPAPRARNAVTRLIRFDLSDPSAPVRVADVAIENEFWRLIPRAGGYWVMSARVNPETLRCEVAPHVCGWVDRDALVLDHYSFAGGAFTLGEELELPMTTRAVSTEHGFVTSEYTESGSLLHIARFDAEGSLAAPESIALESELTPYAPIYIGPERTAFFSNGLQIGPSSGAPTASFASSSGQSTRFTDRGAFVSDGASVTFVDWSDLESLRATDLPAVSVVQPIPSADGSAPTRALGWKDATAGTTLSLLSLDTDIPTIIDSATTELHIDIGASFNLSGEDLWLDTTHMYLAGTPTNAGPGLASVGFFDDELVVQSPLFAEYTREVVSTGAWAYNAGDGLVEGRELAGPGVARLERIAGDTLDVAVTSDAQAVLVRGFDELTRLSVTQGGVTSTLAVSTLAERVLPAGDRWIVLGSMSLTSCEQSGRDCADYAPSIAIVGGAPLAIIAEIPLPSIAPALGPLSRADENWIASSAYGPAPVPLDAGRWLLTRELSATCLTEADCETLGVDSVPFAEAQGVANGTQVADCPPNTAGPCESEPLPEPTVYGTTTRRSYFVVDAATSALSESVDIDAQRDSSWSGMVWFGPRLSGDTLLDLRLEAIEQRSGIPTRVRFWLERLTLVTGGALTRATPLSIPGYPVGLLDASTLITSQPEVGETGRATLHRVHIDGDQTDIESSLSLDARYGDVRLVGSHAVYLRLPTTLCDSETTLESISVSGAALVSGGELSHRLGLPGGNWYLLEVVGDQVLLGDRGSFAYARVSVGESGELSLEDFATAPGYVQGPTWRDGTLYGAGPSGVVRITL